MASQVEFSLVYKGGFTENNAIGFYDVAEALLGFERSLAITTHLILNGEVITQAPALKGAEIFAVPPEIGSWKFKAIVAAGVAMALQFNALPKDTPLGNLVRSAYDFVIRETLGFHVNYDETLGKQYEEYKRGHPVKKDINESKMDSVIEKCTYSIRAMHRPFIFSRTADRAQIVSGSAMPFPVMDEKTYEYINFTRLDETPLLIEGRVSSYNINTFKGRIFCFNEQRPIPFVLADFARTPLNVALVVDSMRSNALDRARGVGDIKCKVFIHYSRTDIVKRYTIIEIKRA